MEAYELYLRRKSFTTQEFLKNLNTYNDNFNWENKKLDYLLKESPFGWESDNRKHGVEIPAKPEDGDMLPFIDFTLDDFKKNDAPENLIKSLEYVKTTLEDQNVLDSDIDLVKILYELDDLYKVINIQYSYINEKNRAIGFTKKVVLFSINRVREIINQKSLE
jgi:hypothetical protein